MKKLQMLVIKARTIRDERGAAGVEYGLLVALIAAIIVGVVTTVGIDVQSAFKKVADALPS
jgi:pilus assembly protein Flp/PilA